MAEDRERWLAQRAEEPLQPERPLVDAHHHLWDYPGNRYLREELLADAAGHNLRQSVFVECLSAYRGDGPQALRPVGETAFVECQAGAGLRAGGPRVAAAIIGHADLCLGAEVAPVLAAHRHASPQRFRGIRHACSWHPSASIRQGHSKPHPHLYMRDDFRAGFAALEAAGLLFESWGYHNQLWELASLARAFPRTTIVLDHVGGPLGIGPYAGRRAQVFEHWQAGIRAVAACANVVVKLGGLAMPVNGFGWHRQAAPPDSAQLETAFAPYFHFCIEQFGPERCVFESNFPVDRASCAYPVLWNAFKRIAARYSQAQQDAMLHDNALALYALEAV